MARTQLSIQSREVTGRKVRLLRRQGMVPAVIYGVKAEPMNVQVAAIDIKRLIRQGHESELLDLELGEEGSTRTVIIHDMQFDPVTDEPIHVDFYEPDLTQPVDVDVEIELVGEAPADVEKRGILLAIVEEVPIRVLPTNIPASIKVDVSSLAEVGDQITIADVELPEGVELMLDNPEDVVVAKIGALRVQQVEEEEEAEEETAEGGEEEASSEEQGESSEE